MRGIVRWFSRLETTFGAPVLIAWATINLIVSVNAVQHSPFVGYDALAHLGYVETLSTGRLPSSEDTDEFFVPPLPYVIPAALAATGARWGLVVKVAQLQNIAWSMLLTAGIVALCRRLQPGDRALPLWSLILIGSLPLYYKMFAFVRGEPLLAALAVWLVERELAEHPKAEWSRGGAVVWGVIAGAMLLSKQFAVFVLVPVALWSLSRRRAWWPRMVMVTTIALVISGWFYASLHVRYGSPAAFIEPPFETTSWRNHPASFIVDPGLPALLRFPIRDGFGEYAPLWPVLYADTWGDYWCYWIVYGVDTATGGWASGPLAAESPVNNRDAIAPFLVRVMILAVPATLLMLLGVQRGLWPSPRRRDAALPALIVISTLAGYVVLLYTYPVGVKPGYQLHAAPFLAIAGALALTSLPGRTRIGTQVILSIAALHNAPAYLTRYIWW